jgi:hypothetical protein
VNADLADRADAADRSAWRESASMLTQKAFVVVAESLSRPYQRSAEIRQIRPIRFSSPFLMRTGRYLSA